MPGIYIHVPFCRQACRYCDFYFTVSLQYRDSFVLSILKEAELRKAEDRYLVFPGEEIDTLYFGGGTPSVLTKAHLENIFSSIHKHYNLKKDAEITLEANPDDLNSEYLKTLQKLGVNRLSIGVQSFREEDLQLMRRSHSADQARQCLHLAAAAGIEDVNIDLIYGIPGLSNGAWQQNVEEAMKLPIHHISAYHLTYESGTVMDHMRKKGRIMELSEQESIDQYHILKEVTQKYGFEHYEISNFAREGYRSRHNTSYWKGENYFGFGPGAHSYNGTERRWNIASVKKYIDKMERGEIYFETELLKKEEKYHEYLMISLRTKEGISLRYIEERFGKGYLKDFMNNVGKHLDVGDILIEGDIVRMSEEAWFRSDGIIAGLI